MNQRARYARRVLRDHRHDHRELPEYRCAGHSFKIANLGDGATIYGWWTCARCAANDAHTSRLVDSLTRVARDAYLAGELTLAMAGVISKMGGSVADWNRRLLNEVPRSGSLTPEMAHSGRRQGEAGTR